jgi:hypothetical protein
MKTKKPEKRYCSFCGQEMILDYVSPEEFDYPIRYDEKTGKKLLYPRYTCPSYIEYARSHRWSLFGWNPHGSYILLDSPIRRSLKK